MNLRAIVLAAGKGTRMNSNIPKVLHTIAGKTILSHVLTVLNASGLSKLTVVSSDELTAQQKFKELHKKHNFDVAIQKKRLGTAHALLAGIKVNKKLEDGIVVICGDTPLLKKRTLNHAIDKYSTSGADIICIGFNAKRPKGYGRFITDEDYILDIVEENDATVSQKKINLCNSGIYIFSKKIVKEILPLIKNSNTNAEYYLTDAIQLANKLGYNCTYITAPEKEVLGVNDKVQLARAEQIIQKRLRRKALLAGVQMLDPNTTYLATNIKFGKDVIIHPNVVIKENVRIGNGCEIYSFSYLEDCKVEAKAKIGPYARLRPGTEIGENVKIGNFVEVKNSKIGNNSKASHLSYIGDADIKDNVNIGAGTIFVNYDGFSKHKTTIGSNVFIGSNCAIVAPVNIDNSAIVGAGSVVTEDVEENMLTIARARQANYKQKAELIRKKNRKPL